MQRRIFYIVNPISGTGKRNSLRDLIESKTRSAGIDFDIYPSVADGDYSFLEHLIEEKKCTDIVIAGGDGTVNQVIKSLGKNRLSFGIIPCGSGNGLAFSAGIPKDHSKALDIIFTGKTKNTDAFSVNKNFACMLCGLGFDASVAHAFAEAPKRGLSTYIKKTLSHFFSASTYSFTLEVGKKKINLDAFFISIANSNQFGNHFTIAPQASLDDGLLDIVVMTRQNKFSVLLQSIKQVTGFNGVKDFDMVKQDAGVIYFQTPSIRIANHEGALMHIDGDPAETAKLIDFKVKPSYFNLIVP